MKNKILYSILGIFLLYILDLFFDHYTFVSPIKIKIRSPIVKREAVVVKKEKKIIKKVEARVREEKEFRPELEAIYIYFGKDITAYAIAMAESGLNCKRKSKTNDYGLMQIHLPLHQWRFDKFGGKWDDCWDNVKVAYQIYKEQGFNPWVVYSTGVYKNYLKEAEQLVNSYFKNK
jgi:hypothetical protein